MVKEMNRKVLSLVLKKGEYSFFRESKGLREFWRGSSRRQFEVSHPIFR